MKFSLLTNIKMPTIVGIFQSITEIFIFISRENSMFSWVEHEKRFITSGPLCSFFLTNFFLSFHVMTIWTYSVLSSYLLLLVHRKGFVDRIFTGRISDHQGCKVSSYGCKVSSCGQRRLWSDFVEAQTDLSLRWRRCTFSHTTALLLFYFSVFPCFIPWI